MICSPKFSTTYNSSNNKILYNNNNNFKPNSVNADSKFKSEVDK